MSESKSINFRLFTILMFTLLALSGLGFSFYMLYIADSLYMYMLAIAFTILALIAGFFNITASIWYYRSFFYTDYLEKIKRGLKPVKTFPTVAVVVPVYNEDPKEVEYNLIRLVALKYPKDKLRYYLLDDSTMPEVARELKAFTAKHGIKYMHRESRKGFKAGALNNFMHNSNEELIAIFDYDEYLTDPDFLMDLLPYFQDKQLSYIQTTKKYASGSLFSDSVELFNGFFFRFIQPARALDNTAIFAGSCGLISRKAIESVGGFPEYVIEDTFFSFESDMHSFKSLYIPKVYALGKPIKTFTELIRQQWRYNYGNTQFISYFLKRSKLRKLSTLPSMDYITHGFSLNYLSFVLVLFTIVSMLIAFSTAPFVSLTLAQFLQAKYLPIDFEAFGIMAFLLSFILPIILTRVYFKSVKKGVMVFLLNYALAISRTKAAVAAIFNKSASAIHWSREIDPNKNRLLFSIYNTKVELLFTGILVALGIYAININHIPGGVWLLWYGVMYSCATILFYKYG
jgi:cellulose synthase (UDP-forming)